MVRGFLFFILATHTLASRVKVTGQLSTRRIAGRAAPANVVDIVDANVADASLAGCPNSNGVIGYSFSHEGHWGGYKDQGVVDSEQQCAKRCSSLTGCVAFHYNKGNGHPSRDFELIDGHCYVYTELGTRGSSGSKAYTKCQAGFFAQIGNGFASWFTGIGSWFTGGYEEHQGKFVQWSRCQQRGTAGNCGSAAAQRRCQGRNAGSALAKSRRWQRRCRDRMVAACVAKAETECDADASCIAFAVRTKGGSRYLMFSGGKCIEDHTQEAPSWSLYLKPKKLA